jgi:DNA-directed RNA polymerase specialized sigma24 family protein
MAIKEREEIAEIYLSKKKILLNIALTYLRNEEHAVDLVANVIVTMLEKERTFPNEETCLAYMKQIVRNGAKNILRKNE